MSPRTVRVRILLLLDSAGPVYPLAIWRVDLEKPKREAARTIAGEVKDDAA